MDREQNLNQQSANADADAQREERPVSTVQHTLTQPELTQNEVQVTPIIQPTDEVSTAPEKCDTATTEPITEPMQSHTPPQAPYQAPYQTNTAYVGPEQAYTAPVQPYTNHTVYVSPNTESPKKAKKEKKNASVGAMIIIASVCVVLSALAAFGGTMAAKYITGENSTSTASQNGTESNTPSNTAPSVIYQSFENPNKEAGTYTAVADAVTPTIVEITTESIATDSYFWGNYVTEGAGSGVIISEDGIIVTNNHVVNGASNITVTLKDGTSYPATVIGTDADSDVAVIKVEATGLPFALLGDSDALTVGEEVVAVGNPLGEFSGTVTNGIVSALSRDISIDGTEMTLIQTNAAVNPGNSGGGLFNMYGELIGIVNAKSTTTSSGTSVEGIGFAIPINTASKVVDELVEFGYVRGRVMLGITYFEVADTYDAFYYRVNALGVYVATSEYNDELKPYDRIVAIDGDEVTYGADIKSAIRDHEVGDEIEVTVVRDGKYVTVKAKLYEYVPETASQDDADVSEFEENFGE